MGTSFGPIVTGMGRQSWVALAAYPWNWTPVVAQRDGETRGYSFGIEVLDSR